MGNKVNANGLRLGVLHTWNSRWFFNDRHIYRQAIIQDIKIRELLFKQLKSAGLTQVEIERNLSGMNIILHAVRPGMIIGRGGKGLEEVKNKISEPILESTNLWDFPTQNYGDRPHGDNKFNGVTPAFVIWNLLQRYTKRGKL